MRARGGQYVESRHAAFASHPSHVHTTPTIALLLRGALEVTFASGRRLSVDASAAAGALARSSAPLAQIALDAGFADQSHFTRVFRTVHGITPLCWRALHGK